MPSSPRIGLDPRAKTLLDAGRESNWQTHVEGQRALRDCLSLIDGARAQLVAALKYLVMTHSNNDPVSTFLAAVIQADGLSGFVDSIASEREFLDCLESDPIRNVLVSDFHDDPRILKWMKPTLPLLSDASFNVVVAMSTLGHIPGIDFLRPGLVGCYGIADLLKWLHIPVREFFPNVANNVLAFIVDYLPKDKAQEWLTSLIRRLAAYYGDEARCWMMAQIESKKQVPFIWQSLLPLLFERSLDIPLGMHLTPEQSAWIRRFRTEHLRNSLRTEVSNLLYHNGGARGQIVIQAPLYLHQPLSDFPGHVYRPVWSWLFSEAAEAAIYSWFHQAAIDIVADYASPEDSITGALCAYLKVRAQEWRQTIDLAWRIDHPSESLRLDMEYVDCRRGRDVGGADLVLVLSARANDRYVKSSFVAFQSKKVTRQSLRLSKRELAQKDQIRAFTHAAYYMFYPCAVDVSDATGPVVLSARTLDGVVGARQTSTVDRPTILGIGKGIEEFLLTDFLPGWSGDERWETPEVIREVVDAALRPVHLLQVSIEVVPREEQRG